MPTKIEWVRNLDGSPGETINPFGWGCYGPGGTAEKPKRCPYCYGYRLARRHLRKCELCQQFVPHWHPEELEKPLRWKQPRKVFVSSMSDPFGEWVPWGQTAQLFAMMQRANWHRFMLLTKQPQNIIQHLEELSRFPLPNVWLGCTLTGVEGEQDPSPYMRELQGMGWHVFVSIEPLLGPIDPSWYDWAEWVILGAMTGPGAVKPELEWIRSILRGRPDVPFFVKDNLGRQHLALQGIQEYPSGLTLDETP